MHSVSNGSVEVFSFCQHYSAEICVNRMQLAQKIHEWAFKWKSLDCGYLELFYSIEEYKFENVKIFD